MENRIREEIARELKIPTEELDDSLSFTARGGHSLSALRLVSTCKQIGLLLTVGELLQNIPVKNIFSRSTPVYDPTDSPPASENTDLSHSDISLPLNLTPSPSPSSPSVRCLTPDTVVTTDSQDAPKIPIPEMQLSLIQGTLANPGNNILAYHCICSKVTKTAWQQVLEAESIFRTDFRIEDGEGYLAETATTSYRWREVQVAHREALYAEIGKRPSFGDVGFEFQVITVAGDDSVACILWHVHHAFIDGFSMQLILNKVSRAVAGHGVEAGPSFATVVRERNLLIKKREDETRQYWDSQREIIEAAASEIRMPRSSVEPGSRGFWNNVATFNVDVSQSQLADYAHHHHVTMPSIYYAAWALVLSIVCDSHVVLLGVVMAGRSLPVPGILDANGSLINTLPMGVQIEGSAETVGFINNIFQQLVELSSFDWSSPDHRYRRQLSSVLAMQFDVGCHTGSLNTPSSRMNKGTIHIQFSPEYQESQINLIGTYFTHAIECLIRPNYTISMCAAATKNPDSCAAQQGTRSMSYRELDQWSDCVAIHLRMYIKQGDVVCVHANPCTYWLVAIYGILKAGGVYCPLNSRLDPELRNSMFHSAGATVYLTPSASETKYRPKGSRYVWAVEDLLQRQDDYSQDKLEHILCPEANAYLCFTSGSTGKPKGVLCTHRGLVAFQKDFEVRLHAEPGRRVAQTMSVSFDGSIHEIFSALSYGATLVLPNTEDPFSHLCDIDSCVFTPSFAATLDPNDYPNLRYVYLVGEQVPQDVNDRWAARVALYNMYGPTEATCVTIGRNRRLAPPGVMGQIYLAGVQRFFPDSVCRGLGEWMYATGDIGYWNEDGELLRGFRLDLDDLEVRIAKLPGITKAAVTRHENDLVAMIQPATVYAADCRKHMATMLPAHAIPRYIIPLDYKAIAQAASIRHARKPSNEMTTTEQLVADIWADILAVEKGQIFLDSNFITIGGHSLLQLRLVGRLSKAFNCSVPLTAVIKAPTPRDLSRKIDKLREEDCRTSLHPPAELDERDVSRMEAEWISKYGCSTSTTSFTVSFACWLDSSVDLHRLKHSWDCVLESHQILRSRYIVRRGKAGRVYSDRAPVAQQIDHCNVLKEINRPFDIAKDDLIRVFISPDIQLVVVSHIICDLTTMQLLLNDVQRVYQGSSLQNPRPEYIGADAWHRAASDADLAFWSSYLKDYPRPTLRRDSYAGTSRVSVVPRETALALEDFITASEFSHHQIALAAVSLALGVQRDFVDTVLGGPFLNRWSEADMNTVGLFLEPLPFRIQFDPNNITNADAHAFLESVKCSSQAAISHAVPWQELLCHLDVTQEYPSHPLLETMVTFHTTGDRLSLGIDGVEPFYTWSEGAKFGLMCEFTASADGEILLRLEYDEGIYSTEEIHRFEKRITHTLGLLVKNMSYADMISKLRAVDGETTTIRP
ncbi:hypothetical protein BDW75DRAFT_230453 [Aspergillus navahoensis]